MKKKVTIPKTNFLPPIHLACSDDFLRPALTHVLIDDGKAIATDAHIMVCLDLEQESQLSPDSIKELNRVLIPAKVWDKMRTSVNVTCQNGVINFIDKDGHKFSYTPPADQPKFPDYKAIIPTKKDFQGDIDSIALAPHLLLKIDKILKSPSGLQLDFYGRSKAIIAHNYDHPKSFALIMPLMKDNYDRYFN